ncbi:hypothetical protein FOL46_009354 [Perkinsus olseni]|uniref:Choline transporter-like protein n=1 Tax=Perkinsus olseni TaxID=32597 RepID=A0A7J6MKT2_PEROL|nr:hypothetical protein FOL46_009354 [Perkinsus olseni]
MTSLAIIWAYAASYADLRRISHRFNYRGNKRHLSLKNYLAVLDKPFLYWCAGIEDGSHTTLAMNYENPICVERCPTEGDPLEMLPCPMPARVDIVRTGDAPYTGNTTTITQVVVPQRGLDTVPLAGRYCIPKDTFLSKQVLRGPLLEQPQQAIDYLLELKNASKDVAAGLLAAILTSYGYIILLRNNAKLVATASLAGLVIASVAFGIACLRNTTTAANANPRLLSRIVGILCFALAFGCMLVSYKAQEAFRLGSAYAQETCKVVFSVPSLFLYPMVDASIKVTVAGILGRGFLWLVASGSVNTERALINGHEITDSHRTFAYSGKELCMMVYWLAATLWVFEFLMALSHFAVSYATMLYYFAPTEISGERQSADSSTLNLPWSPERTGLSHGDDCLGITIDDDTSALEDLILPR